MRPSARLSGSALSATEPFFKARIARVAHLPRYIRLHGRWMLGRRLRFAKSPMIVDCHAHVIQNWIGACGHPTRDLHMKYLQRVIAGTVARTYRARDGAPADTKALIRADEHGMERTARCRLPRRPLRPARIHRRWRGLLHPVHAGRHAKPGSTAGADAGADDLCRRRSCGAAGGRRLWRNDRVQRIRAARSTRRSLLR